MRKMMRLLIFFFCSVLYAQKLEGEWHGYIQFRDWKSDIPISWYYFSNNSYQIDTTVAGYEPLISYISKEYVKDGYYDENGTFKCEEKEGLAYIVFTSSADFTLKKRLGVLYSQRRLFLYDGDGIFFEPDENYTWAGYSPEITAVRTSSSLKEGSVVYDGTQFIRVPGVKLQPWAEGKEGNGIGEWIEFDVKSRWNTEKLLIANGYISFNKPYLYRNNNRIKEYEITSQSLAKPLRGTLKDTPELQEIVLPEMIKNKEYTMRLTIKSVYRGDKWDDTCLTLVYPMPPEPPSKYGEKY